MPKESDFFHGLLGRRLLLLPSHRTRRYVLRDKTDEADAGALLEAHRNERIVPG